MLIYVGKPHNKLIATQEGTGDNLFDEDIKEGIVDYWLSSVYQQNGEEIVLVDSGQIMTSTLIKDMDMGEKIQRILEYWDMTDGEYNILEKEEL
jgi:hypothetical protein